MNNKITAVIIDDIESARRNMRDLLQSFVSKVEIIGEADNVISGVKLVNEVNPDILFLDIEMPGGSGFDLIDLLHPEVQSKIIFTTGSDDYAIQAFRVSAVDYLLKPIDPDDLQDAVEKATKKGVRAATVKEVMQENDEKGQPTRMAFHTSDEIIISKIEDIVRCQSMDNYCQVYLTSGKAILMSKPLKYYADILVSYDFFRTHQSHLVNRRFVESYVKKEGGYLLMVDGSQIPVSIRNRPELMLWLSKGLL